MYDLLRPCADDSFDELHCFHSNSRESNNLNKFDATVISTTDDTPSSSSRRQDNFDLETNTLVPRASRPPHESAYGSPRIHSPNASLFDSPSPTRTRHSLIYPFGPYQDPPSPNQGGMAASYGAPASTTATDPMSTTTPSESATLSSVAITNESATPDASVAAEVTTVTTADTLTTTAALEDVSSATSTTSTSDASNTPTLTTEMVVLTLEGELVTFGLVTRTVSESLSETSDKPQDSATSETASTSQASGPDVTTLITVPSTTPIPTTSTGITNLTDTSSGRLSEASSNSDTTSSSWPAAKVLGPTITLCLLGLIAFFAFLIYRHRRNQKRIEDDVVSKAEWYGLGPAPDQSLGHNGSGSSLTRGSSRRINTGLGTWNEKGDPRTGAGATASTKTRPPSIADMYASDGIRPYWCRPDFGIRMREKMMAVDESKTAPLPTALPTVTPTPMSGSRDSGVGLSADTRHEHDHDHDISMSTNKSASTSGLASVAVAKPSNATTDPDHHRQRRLSVLSEKTEKTNSSTRSMGISTTSNSMDLIERELYAPRRISPPKSPLPADLPPVLPTLLPTQSQTQNQHTATHIDVDVVGGDGGGSSPVTPTTTLTSSLLPNPPSTPRSISTTSTGLRALRDSECDGGMGWRLYRGLAEVRPYVAAGSCSERDGEGEGEGEDGVSRRAGRKDGDGDRGRWKGKKGLMGRAMGSLRARLGV